MPQIEDFTSPAGSFVVPGHRRTPMSRAEMEAVIDNGESIMFMNRVITRKENLPSDAELAVGDPVKEQAAVAALRAEIENKQRIIEALLARQGGQDAPSGAPDLRTVETPTPAPPTPPGPAGVAPLAPEARESLKAAQRAALVDPNVPIADDLPPVASPPPPPLPEAVARQVAEQVGTPANPTPAPSAADKGKANQPRR